MSHISPFFVLPGEGASMDTLIDAPVTIKAGTRSTNGSLAVLEFVHGPKAGPPLHTHLREDEMWYVLQGDYRFKAGDSTFQLSTGGMAFVPRGVSHSFQNLNDTPGRMLIIVTPSGMYLATVWIAALKSPRAEVDLITVTILMCSRAGLDVAAVPSRAGVSAGDRSEGFRAAPARLAHRVGHRRGMNRPSTGRSSPRT